MIKVQERIRRIMVTDNRERARNSYETEAIQRNQTYGTKYWRVNAHNSRRGKCGEKVFMAPNVIPTNPVLAQLNLNVFTRGIVKCSTSRRDSKTGARLEQVRTVKSDLSRLIPDDGKRTKGRTRGGRCWRSLCTWVVRRSVPRGSKKGRISLAGDREAPSSSVKTLQ